MIWNNRYETPRVKRILNTWAIRKLSGRVVYDVADPRESYKPGGSIDRTERRNRIIFNLL